MGKSRGPNLITSFIFSTHWLDTDYVISPNMRIRYIYEMLHSTCLCLVCRKSPEERSRFMKEKLSSSQKQAALECWHLEQCRRFNIPPKKCINELYKTLALLNNVKFSPEYKKVYANLVNFQMYLSFNKLGNIILSKDC